MCIMTMMIIMLIIMNRNTNDNHETHSNISNIMMPPPMRLPAALAAPYGPAAGGPQATGRRGVGGDEWCRLEV